MRLFLSKFYVLIWTISKDNISTCMWAYYHYNAILNWCWGWNICNWNSSKSVLHWWNKFELLWFYINISSLFEIKVHIEHTSKWSCNVQTLMGILKLISKEAEITTTTAAIVMRPAIPQHQIKKLRQSCSLNI